MDVGSQFLVNLNIWTKKLGESQNEIDTQLFREIIHKCQEINTKHSSYAFHETTEVQILNIANQFKSHLNHEDVHLEHLILCSTTYSLLLIFLSNKDKLIHLQDANQILCNANHQMIEDIEKSNDYKLDTMKNRQIERKIATYIGGFYQSILLKPSQNDCEEIKQIKYDIIYNSLNTTSLKCLIYSSCTFLHFKNLHSILNRLIDWEMCDTFLDENKQKCLLYVVFNNWENLINGIREWNVKIWNCLLRIINKNKSEVSFNKIINSVMEFPWNKAKYFVLSEIILFYDVINFIQNYPKVICGLQYSLKHYSMISAGTNFYRKLLDNFKTYEDWCEVFLNMFLSTFLTDDRYAVKNLINYWIPVTVKRFPNIFNKLVTICLENKSEKTLFAFINLFKFGRKNGFLLNNWIDVSEEELQVKSIISMGLVNVDEDVRAQAFHVVCETNKQNIPCSEELNLVKEFLELNINNDSTSLRQSNLNSFTLFFIRIHDSYLKLLKNNEKNDILNNVDGFVSWLFDFLDENLDGLGNYQRRIMSLQIYNIVLQYLCKRNNNKNNSNLKKFTRKGNLFGQGHIIAEYLKNTGSFKISRIIKVLIDCLNDSTEDIRETAADILINYFINDESFSLEMQQALLEKALKLCNSCMFYESDSGCSMLRILANVENNGESTIHKHLLKESFDQFQIQQKDFFVAIFQNKPLHGVISGLNVYLKNHHKIQLDDTFITSITELLESVSDYFINILALKSTSGTFPPSFGEMGESVDELIKMSSFKQNEGDEITQPVLSDAHQLVLNNIWLNLKACCELSSTIITKLSDAKENLNLLDICVAVLTKCRHKGAIESAGLFLGLSIKHLTSMGDAEINSAVSQLLEGLLVEFTSANRQGGSVTRRSAGLTILVHRMVTNDLQDEKPLFHLTMRILLRALTQDDVELLTVQMSSAGDIANEKDIPLARAIHLLCRTVCDSSLSSYIIQYAHQLAYVCFRHLTSQQWQIRNGALQLYGALVPKLIGQRKSTNDDEDISEAPVSIDELFCHIPLLRDIVEKALKEACETDTLTSHSDIIPILSLLSSTAKRYCLPYFTCQFYNQSHIPSVNIEDLMPYLMNLLGSSIWTVRDMCAKIINTFYNINVYKRTLIKTGVTTKENYLHGYLLALKCYIKDYQNNIKNVLGENEEKVYFQNAIDVFEFLDKNVKIKQQISFVVKANLAEIQQLLQPNDLNNFVIDDSDRQIKPGFYLYVNIKLSYILKYCDERNLAGVVKKYFCNQAIDEFSCLSSLKWRLLNKAPKDLETLKTIFDIFMKIRKSPQMNNSKKVYEIMYIICSTNDTIVLADDVFKRLVNINEEIFVKQHCRTYLLPLLCQALYVKNRCGTSLLSVSKYCKLFSKSEHFDAETRLISAVSLKYLTQICEKSCTNGSTDDLYEFKSNVFISVIWLLQDECSDVRKECAKIEIYKSKDGIRSEYFQLNKIVDRNFIWQTFQSSSIRFLRDLWSELPNQKNINEKDLTNPFNNPMSNIYWEPIRLKNRIQKLIEEIKERNSVS